MVRDGCGQGMNSPLAPGPARQTDTRRAGPLEQEAAVRREQRHSRSGGRVGCRGGAWHADGRGWRNENEERARQSHGGPRKGGAGSQGGAHGGSIIHADGHGGGAFGPAAAVVAGAAARRSLGQDRREHRQRRRKRAGQHDQDDAEAAEHAVTIVREGRFSKALSCAKSAFRWAKFGADVSHSGMRGLSRRPPACRRDQSACELAACQD